MCRILPSVLPDISPTGGEIGRRHDLRFIRNVQDGRVFSRESISLLVGEMPGRAEGGMPRAAGRLVAKGNTLSSAITPLFNHSRNFHGFFILKRL